MNLQAAAQLVLAGVLSLLAPPALAADAAAAQSLMRQNNCLRCHSVEKAKEGPAFNKVAAKYKGKTDAEDRLVFHLTSAEKAKFADGHEEEHKVIKTTPANDAAQIKNLVQWILSQ